MERVADRKLELIHGMVAEVDAMWSCLWPWRWRTYFRHWARFRELREQLRDLDET